jgi:hypothetical protein
VDIQHYALPIAVTLRLQSRSGKVHVIAEPRDDIEAQGDRLQMSEEDDGATLQLRAGRGSGNLVVRCPAGTDIVVGTHSGSVRLEGRFGDVSITTMSGGIDLEAADQADLRTMSANISVGSCAGAARTSSISGRIDAGTAGSAVASTMSGAITFERVRGAFRARSVGGSIEASCDGEGAIAVKTVSGKVRLTLPAGMRLEACCKTMSGRVDCPFPSGGDLRVDAVSVSGSIQVVPL